MTTSCGWRVAGDAQGTRRNRTGRANVGHDLVRTASGRAVHERCTVVVHADGERRSWQGMEEIDRVVRAPRRPFSLAPDLPKGNGVAKAEQKFLNGGQAGGGHRPEVARWPGIRPTVTRDHGHP